MSAAALVVFLIAFTSLAYVNRPLFLLLISLMIVYAGVRAVVKQEMDMSGKIGPKRIWYGGKAVVVGALMAAFGVYLTYCTWIDFRRP